MRTFRYVLCDVFTDRPLTGNPLAVFTDGRGLSTETQQAIAREMNLSETVFVLPPERGGLGLDAVWADDFHHQARRAFAGDKQGYYADYTGSAADIARSVLFALGQPEHVQIAQLYILPVNRW